MLWAARLANQILSSAVLITSFSLFLYTLRHNYRSAVARAFCLLLSFVMVVYLGDAAILGATAPASTVVWLKFQWVGIAFTPAVYLHFSDALLNVTGSFSKRRRAAVFFSYAGSAAILFLVIFTAWVVREHTNQPQLLRLQAGPLFFVFTVYFFATVVSGAININYARRRCLTLTSQRRMGYLMASFAAPALGVFPYMLLSTLPASLREGLLMLILLLGNVGILFMIIVMAYTVAYFGAFNPDRVIKYGLIEYLMRGPVVASIVLVILATIPSIERFLGLSGDLITMGVATTTIIMAQWGIGLSRPLLNRLVYRQDLREVSWLQVLNQRLLTPSDLEQFLENVLSLLAELLRVGNAFVVTHHQDDFQLEAHCGDMRVGYSFLQEHNLKPALGACQRSLEEGLRFSPLDGYVLYPLGTRDRDAVLGLLVIERWPLAPQVDDSVSRHVFDLIDQAAEALEDRYLQQGIYAALQQIMPNIERIQKRRQLMHYVTSLPQPIRSSPVNSASFTHWVKDALSHYWGGPKLTGSPLLDLSIVEAVRDQNDGDNVRALRAVLQRAIDALRPTGEQSMTAAEWTLYNILDLKFRQGLRMNEIANLLAVSESDLYRKQRVAIEEMARMLVSMEHEVHSAD